MKFTVEVELTTEGHKESVEDVGNALHDELSGYGCIDVEDSEYELDVLSVTHHR